jgi:hypothetical protein
VPGGVLIDLPYHAYEQRLEATRRALAEGAPVIYEASFRADGVFVTADVLERQGPGTARGFCLTEVKSTTSVKEQHLPDVAVQAHVLRRSGLEIVRMTDAINRARTRPRQALLPRGRDRAGRDAPRRGPR